MKKIVACVVTAAIVLFVLAWLVGVVGFHYAHVIENEPLIAPVEVTNVDGNRLVLADGRALEVDAFPGQLTDLLSQSDFMIDLETEGEDAVLIYARQDGWICGTRWAQPIRIPIFRDTVYKNRRQLIAHGRITRIADSAAPESYPRAVRAINDQIAKFNADRMLTPDKGITQIKAKFSRIERTPGGAGLTCFDQEGKPFLTLKETADGTFVGELRTPYHELAKPEGHTWGEVIVEIRVEKGLLEK